MVIGTFGSRGGRCMTSGSPGSTAITTTPAAVAKKRCGKLAPTGNSPPCSARWTASCSLRRPRRCDTTNAVVVAGSQHRKPLRERGVEHDHWVPGQRADLFCGPDGTAARRRMLCSCRMGPTASQASTGSVPGPGSMRESWVS